MKLEQGKLVKVKKLGGKLAVILEVLEDGKAARVHVKEGARLAFDPVYREYELERDN